MQTLFIFILHSNAVYSFSSISWPFSIIVYVCRYLLRILFHLHSRDTLYFLCGSFSSFLTPFTCFGCISCVSNRKIRGHNTINWLIPILNMRYTDFFIIIYESESKAVKNICVKHRLKFIGRDMWEKDNHSPCISFLYVGYW